MNCRQVASIPRLAVVVVYFNRPDITLRCLESVFGLDYPNFEVIAVNNGSDPAAGEVVKTAYPDLTQIHIIENQGFNPAVSAGMAAALERQADYVLVLPNDVVLDPHLLHDLVAVAEGDASIGITGVVNYDMDQPEVIVWTGGYVTNWWLGTRKAARHHKAADLPDQPFEVDYPPIYMTRADVIRDIGYFDSQLYMYYDELDYCLRAKQAGYKVVIAPKAKLWHEVSNKTHGRINTYFMVRNEPRYFYRNAHWIYWPSFTLWYLLRTLAKLSASAAIGLLRGNWLHLAVYGLGLGDFLLGRYGRGSIDRLSSLQAKYTARQNEQAGLSE